MVTTGGDEFDVWLGRSIDAVPGFAEALEDAECRSNLLRHLVDMRRSSDLSQKAVADKMKTTQSSISELEGGGTDPRLSTLQRYARAIEARLTVHVDQESALGYGRVTSVQHVDAVSGLRPSASIGQIPINWSSHDWEPLHAIESAHSAA